MCGVWSPACLKQVEAREPEGGDVVCAGHIPHGHATAAHELHKTATWIDQPCTVTYTYELFNGIKSNKSTP